MSTICREFEGETEGEGEEVRQARSERIMQLMQQVREKGRGLRGGVFDPSFL